jgi:hypothetical protein
LDEFLADLQREYEKGRMEDVPDRDTFRIVEVK